MVEAAHFSFLCVFQSHSSRKLYMRLHFNLCLAVVRTLEKIFHDGEYADKAIERVLKTDNRWGSRDRGFIAETTYDIVRYFRWHVEIAGDPRHSLMDWWELLGCYLSLKDYEMPPWDVFENNKYGLWKKRAEELKTIRKFKESIPDWIDEIGEKELGEKWDETLHHLNKKAKVVLRVNTLKGDQSGLLKGLNKEGVEGEKLGDTSIVLKKRSSVFRTKLFKNGFFEVQDYSSQQVSEFLEVEPGMRVFDACAGAGGKTLHLAALMQNKGQIIALDNVEWKLLELKKRAKRAGAHIIERRHIDSTKVIKRLKNSADRLLLDAPCSGLGVLRRNPDAKWKLTPDFLENIKKTQREIISSYSRMVKPGGKMVYATCSILPSENKDQVDWFLGQNDEWTFVKDKSILPQDEGFDGFYMALLEKKVDQ